MTNRLKILNDSPLTIMALLRDAVRAYYNKFGKNIYLNGLPDIGEKYVHLNHRGIRICSFNIKTKQIEREINALKNYKEIEEALEAYKNYPKINFAGPLDRLHQKKGNSVYLLSSGKPLYRFDLTNKKFVRIVCVPRQVNGLGLTDKETDDLMKRLKRSIKKQSSLQ